MSELMPDPMLTPRIDAVKEVIILDDDRKGSETLRRTLSAFGYAARVMADADAALDALRASEEPLALLFDVEAYGQTLDGESYVALIGMLLNDPALVQRHRYGVLSFTADEVEAALGKTLTRLGAPIFRKPCDSQTLAGFLTGVEPASVSEPASTFGVI